MNRFAACYAPGQQCQGDKEEKLFHGIPLFGPNNLVFGVLRRVKLDPSAFLFVEVADGFGDQVEHSGDCENCTCRSASICADEVRIKYASRDFLERQVRSDLALITRLRADLAAAQERAGAEREAEGIIQDLLAEPHGCRFCDSGLLRSEKPHDADCPYEQAINYLARLAALPPSEPKYNGVPSCGCTTTAQESKCACDCHKGPRPRACRLEPKGGGNDVKSV